MIPESLDRLIRSFRMLSGVGEKTAERYAMMVFGMSEEQVEQFAQAMMDVKTKLHTCPVCGNLTEHDLCSICKDHTRNTKQIFVVQSSKDVLAMERIGEFHGVYHVLNGLISSHKGILPEDLNIDRLLERARDAEEVILATSATMDGETTALYLDRLLKQNCPDVLVTRIGHGLPSGGLLDYADEMTLSHALSERRRMG